MPHIELPSIDHGKGFDWGKTSANYAKYRDIYPASFYEKLREFGIGLPGQHVLDLGTGTGVLPRNLGGARFTGTDISPEQIAQAQKLSQGMDIAYHITPAEEINFPANSFDAATAVQCFHYMDRSKLMPKLHHVLRPSGLFAICSMIYLPHECEICRGSEALVLKYSPEWTGGNFKRREGLPAFEWAKPLFEAKHHALYCEDIPFTRESWHGRMLSCRGVEASLPSKDVAAFTKEHWTYMQTLPEEFTVKHQVAVFVMERRYI